MKNSHAIGLVAVSVLITVGVEELRIAGLRSPSAGPAEKPVAQSTASAVTSPNSAETTAESASPTKKVRPESSPEKKATEGEDESFAKTARKMWDNPAGKSMMSQSAKMAVAMLYEDFINGLNLNKDEEAYLKNLLGKEVADQQELGMKMMSGTAEEKKALVEELKKRGDENQAEIKKFLNSEEDYKAFTDYKNHLPERQQLDGLRSVMNTKGVPLDSETETKLVEAMYRARTGAKGPDLSGPQGMEELAKGNIVETYEKSWEAQQDALRKETGKILSEEQNAAFQDYQKQMKEMQLMGLKMAEKMMSEKKAGE
ncbi:hypothetical protein JIN84_10045 [Luteolibacter yonseiensis]|uniref:Uncharacterized protein n=1 Tax=Luteolibacter yonseiensis TaxID=1144680 RepID=A0A934VBI1_9BACT|nr:hypothetical protein [Luteolibacter yonseiensis]MBK1815961.1 hypothetical protein [Luteolibacter yonseiensis]